MKKKNPVSFLFSHDKVEILDCKIHDQFPHPFHQIRARLSKNSETQDFKLNLSSFGDKTKIDLSCGEIIKMEDLRMLRTEWDPEQVTDALFDEKPFYSVQTWSSLLDLKEGATASQSFEKFLLWFNKMHGEEAHYARILLSLILGHCAEKSKRDWLIIKLRYIHTSTPQAYVTYMKNGNQEVEEVDIDIQLRENIQILDHLSQHKIVGASAKNTYPSHNLETLSRNAYQHLVGNMSQIEKTKWTNEIQRLKYTKINNPYADISEIDCFE